MKLAVGGMAAIVCCAVYAAGPTPKERFDKAVVGAKANLATPAGRAYDQALSAHFESHNGEVMSQCFQATPHPDASPFEMVFNLSSAGKAREVLVWPETNIASCFKKRLNAASFPAPPKDDYLAYMEMRFAP